MANEATVRASLMINGTGELKYRSHPNEFRADVAGNKGPVPGAFTAAVAGTDVDLSELTTPGFCYMQNLDPTNFVEVGIWDGVEFYPILELLPGEEYVFRLTRNIGKSFGTGTGTVDTTVYAMRVKADTAACNVRVEAFEV